MFNILITTKWIGSEACRADQSNEAVSVHTLTVAFQSEDTAIIAVNKINNQKFGSGFSQKAITLF